MLFIQALTNLSLLIVGSSGPHCPPPAVAVTDPSGHWDADMNDGAGGKYVYLCATYTPSNASVSRIVALQAAGLTSKYKPNCAQGYVPLDGDVTAGSRNPHNVFLCVQRDSRATQSDRVAAQPIQQLSGALASTGCPKSYRAVSSAESRPSSPSWSFWR